MTEVKPPHPAAPLRTDGAAGRSQDGAGLWPLVETPATLWGTVNGGAQTQRLPREAQLRPSAWLHRGE